MFRRLKLAQSAGQHHYRLRVLVSVHRLDKVDAWPERDKRRFLCSAAQRNGDVPDPSAIKLPSQLDAIQEGGERSSVSVLDHGDDDDKMGADLDYLQVSTVPCEAPANQLERCCIALSCCCIFSAYWLNRSKVSSDFHNWIICSGQLV
jgi:hypothetical protein